MCDLLYLGQELEAALLHVGEILILVEEGGLCNEALALRRNLARPHILLVLGGHQDTGHLVLPAHDFEGIEHKAPVLGKRGPAHTFIVYVL